MTPLLSVISGAPSRPPIKFDARRVRYFFTHTGERSRVLKCHARRATLSDSPGAGRHHLMTKHGRPQSAERLLYPPTSSHVTDLTSWTGFFVSVVFLFCRNKSAIFFWLAFLSQTEFIIMIIYSLSFLLCSFLEPKVVDTMNFYIQSDRIIYMPCRKRTNSTCLQLLQRRCIVSV